MKKTLLVKLRINKANNQVNINLPRKELPDDFFRKLPNKKLLKLILEDI